VTHAEIQLRHFFVNGIHSALVWRLGSTNVTSSFSIFLGPLVRIGKVDKLKFLKIRVKDIVVRIILISGVVQSVGIAGLLVIILTGTVRVIANIIWI
jgi:hypothetical protein